MKGIKIIGTGLRVAILVALGFTSCVASAQLNNTWIQQLNDPRTTFPADVAVDSSGYIYVNGDHDGPIGESPGGYDSYLTKYDSNGNKIWSRQFGSAQLEETHGIAIDTVGSVMRKYDGAGNVLWTHQFGTSGLDVANGAAADAAGNVFVTGAVHSIDSTTIADVFVRKYDSAGTLAWESFLGTTAEDQGNKIAADGSGNVYVCGYTEGQFSSEAFGGDDAFLAKFRSDGVPLWIQQIGTGGQDLAFDVAVDAQGNSYVAGRLNGRGFLAKYDTFGHSIWTRQLSNPSVFSQAESVSLDGLGNVFISGNVSTNGFWAEYSSAGVLLQLQEPGVLYTTSPSVAAGPFGSVYTFGSTIFVNTGSQLVKFVLVPEPESASLFGVGCVLAGFLSHRGRYARGDR
jgi:hypothetical protein